RAGPRARAPAGPRRRGEPDSARRPQRPRRLQQQRAIARIAPAELTPGHRRGMSDRHDGLRRDAVLVCELEQTRRVAVPFELAVIGIPLDQTHRMATVLIGARWI